MAYDTRPFKSKATLAFTTGCVIGLYLIVGGAAAFYLVR